ncbi:ATP-binding cassette domain-containing protein, partial [uncultured Amaricoccus sp.]
MAEPPLLTLADVSLTFGGDPLLAGASLVVAPGERIALVGRNGSGKSTLLKIMAGQVAADAGVRFVRPGVAVGYMAQDPDFAGFATLGAFAAQGLPEHEGWRAEAAMAGLALDPGLAPAAASGGERRRAALAKILAEAPDLMLLDEPTNHLDIHAIAWLEAHLSETRAAFVAVSHDRAFLRNLTDRLLWVDRGEVRRLDRGFAAFEAWRDKVHEEEDVQRHKLDRLIKAEGRWAVEGISARRRRNQGRVRRLEEMRAERREQIL